MSVKIFRKIYEDDDSHWDEEEFEIYKTDSLETIKTRYFINHEIFPKLASFKITPFNSLEESKEEKTEIEIKTIKIFDKINKSKFTSLEYEFIKDKDWNINPLENMNIYIETFKDFINTFTDIDLNSSENMMSFVTKISIDCQEKFGMQDMESILFYIALSYYSNIEEEETFQESLNNIEAMIYGEFPTFALFEFFDNKQIRKRYEDFWTFQKEEYERSKKISKNIIEENQTLGLFLNNLESLGKVSTTHEIISTYNKKKESPIRTPLIETDYIYIGSCNMQIDAYEIFNKLSPNKLLPFLNIGKFYKLLNEFNFPEKWISDLLSLEEESEDYQKKEENIDESTLNLFIYGKKDVIDSSIQDPEHKDYFMITLKQKGQIKDKFPFEIKIKANKQIQLTQEEIIERCINLISIKLSESELILPESLQLKKIFGNGFFAIKNLEIPREIFFDFCFTHPELQKIMIIDESYKILKERGGIKFFTTMNNFETKIKASLIYKKIQKPTDDEIEAYPGLVSMKDKLLLFKISQAENRSELMKLISIITGAIVYMFQNQNQFYDFYKLFIKDITSISTLELEEDEEMKLKDIFPKIFMSGYARDVCQDPPKIIFDKKEIEMELKNPNTDIFLFPKGNVPESAYYSCAHNKSKRFVGLIKNKLGNMDKYPFLPCCFVKDHKKPKKIRFSYENEDAIITQEKGFNQVVYTQKIIKENQYAFLPDNLSDLFNIIDQRALLGLDRYMRLGIQQSPFSVIYCILKALGLQTDKESVKKVRTQIYNLSDYNLASQNGLSEEDIKKVILNNETIDALYFYPILENIFKTNLIILCKDRGELIDGGICNPSYKLFYMTDTTKVLFEKSIIIFRTYGGEFDKLKYPHHELVVKESNFTEQLKIKGTIQMNYQNNTNFINSLNAIQLSTMNFKAISLNFKSKIIKQVNDGNGKIRILYLEHLETKETINVITSPIANFYKDKFVQDSSSLKKYQSQITKLLEVDINIAIDFFTLELSQKEKDSIRKVLSNSNMIETENVIGLYAFKDGTELYIPTKHIDSDNPLIKDIQEYDLVRYEYPAPNSLSLSLIGQYNKYVKISNIITSNCLFLFSHLYQDRLKKIRFTATTETFESDIEELILDFGDNISISKVDIEKSTRNLFLDNELIIKNEEELIVPSEEIKKKLLYVIYINIKYNLNELIDYRYKKYVTDFYTTPKDFDISDNYNIFFTMKELMFTKRRERWDPILKYTVYSNIPIKGIGKVSGKINYQDHFFFQNANVFENRLMIVQKCKSLEHALYVSKEWNKTKINKVRYQGELEEKQSNYILYYSNENDSEINSSEIINNDLDDEFKLVMVASQGEITEELGPMRSEPTLVYFSMLPM